MLSFQNLLFPNSSVIGLYLMKNVADELDIETGCDFLIKFVDRISANVFEAC